jgi:hypothetical protein
MKYKSCFFFVQGPRGVVLWGRKGHVAGPRPSARNKSGRGSCRVRAKRF